MVRRIDKMPLKSLEVMTFLNLFSSKQSYLADIFLKNMHKYFFILGLQRKIKISGRAIF